jgi:hypothetical protein
MRGVGREPAATATDQMARQVLLTINQPLVVGAIVQVAEVTVILDPLLWIVGIGRFELTVCNASGIRQG